MTALDTLLALAAIAAGVACVVVAIRMTSGLGRFALLVVLLAAVLVGCGVPLPDWHDITDYLTPTPTEVNR